jgi:hypothetical protein
MSDKSKKNRRLFLKSAAAMGVAGMGAKAGAQDIQRMPRPTLPQRELPQLNRGRVSQSRNLGMVSLRQGLGALNNQAASLLRNDSLIPRGEAERTVELVRELVSQLDEDFTGIVRIDLAYGPDGDPRVFSCGSNTCGTNTCGTNTCGTNNCGSQTCGSNSCTSNASAGMISEGRMPEADRQQWQIMQRMQREMDSRFIELNVIQIG